MRGRPSFYDLIKQRTIDQLSIATAKLVEVHQTVAASSIPLPTSPAKATTNLVYTAVTEETQSDTRANTAVKMVPVSLRSPICRRLELLADFDPGRKTQTELGTILARSNMVSNTLGDSAEPKLTKML